jgi:hypothetical protein
MLSLLSALRRLLDDLLFAPRHRQRPHVSERGPDRVGDRVPARDAGQRRPVVAADGGGPVALSADQRQVQMGMAQQGVQEAQGCG